MWRRRVWDPSGTPVRRQHSFELTEEASSVVQVKFEAHCSDVNCTGGGWRSARGGKAQEVETYPA
jgi:hypothetical protein